ncbi:AGE family epimerase/isomerase [Maricaulis sp.]|uniref:AGE family epimerase/isomerase n=1 Tax=Maricaulis sp. TaxID=1486257 RepID=UPI002B277B1C|nr:AGE family epimerase/isomerase [Maricaulis sp.]
MADWASRLREWGVETALPFWSERAWDKRFGGFLESLSLDGQPVTGDTRRVRTQARQIYVFARAHHAGWSDGLDLAVEGFELLERRAHAPDGTPGWVHTLTASGEIESPARDLYDHAFILLALSWLHRVTHDSHYRQLADEILIYLDTHLTRPQGGYAEAIGAAQLPRRQNPHMHLFEALLAWYDATGDQTFLTRIEAIYQLFSTRFLDRDAGVLYEFFDADWQVTADPAGAVVEPGHEVEWIWLLHAYRDHGASVDETILEFLHAHGTGIGRNRGTGCLVATVRPDGQTLDAGSRTWMQTEWLRAAAARQRAGHRSAGTELETVCDLLFRHHLDPAIPGGWIDQIDASGHRVADRMPASTLYHVLGAVVDAHRADTEVAESAAKVL